MCCDGRNKNKISNKNTFSDDCRVSIQTTWTNEKERENLADLWDCLQMETCSVNVTKSKTNTCLCTTKLCAKIKCDVLQKDCNQLTVSCKMKTIPANHHVCLNYYVINDLRDQNIHIMENGTCIKHGEREYEVKETQLRIKDVSNIQTDAILNFKEQRNSMILHELKDAVSDLLISTKRHQSVIVISEKASVYLCVTGINKNLCIIIKCREDEHFFKDNEKNGTSSTKDMQYSLSNFWKHWKDKILLVILGVFIFGGILGFLFGITLTRKRKINLQTEYKRRHPRHACNSELYAEISESSNIKEKGRNQNTSEEVELEKKSKRSAIDGLVSSSSSMDGAYSNIYNVLQQNYGQRRNSYPFDDMDSKKVCNKYNSLEKLNVSMEFEGQLHIRDKTPISVVLSK
eukprot:XP_019923250.1 PREDICTED: uncharacterized protein LOC105329427 [Crassostrea gigas]